MCGICGFNKANKEDISMLKRMCDTMRHRGPDGEGYYIDNGIALGHRRLSLVDLENGDQPIIKKNNNKDSLSWHSSNKNLAKHGDYAIVLNGEIYNYKKIRQELIDLDYNFSTKSDTEVVLNGYIEWGYSILDKLRGMFAFCIWDNIKKEMFCARDFFGIKPFYYTIANNTFVFASEIKVLLQHKDVKPIVNKKALEQYLCFQFSSLNETFFEGIFVLPQGHYMIVGKDGIAKLKRYWRPKFRFKLNKKITDNDSLKIYKNHEKLVKEINNVMHKSVEYHNIADVEVGSLLSSGIDSSYNAAMLAEINPDIKTFTVGFDAYKGDKDEYDGERNEIAWAEELAKKIDVENFSHTINEKEYWEALPKIAWHMDEPNGDPSAVALYFVDKLAAKHVKAVLSGEGADELFGGYTIYQTPIAYNKLSWLPKSLLKFLAHCCKTLNIRGSHLFQRSLGVERWYYTNAYGTAFSPEERNMLLKRPTENIKNPLDIVKNKYDEANEDDIDDCTKMQYIDLNFWILGDILLKGDKMSMAHSLECRVPFLDKEVFKIASGLPTKEKISETQTKIALRDASKTTIPKSWAEKKKLGFPVPMVKWLREDKYYEIIKNEFMSNVSKKYFNTDYLISLLDNHKKEIVDNSRKIWIVYMFLLWHKVFFEDNNLYNNHNTL